MCPHEQKLEAAGLAHSADAVQGALNVLVFIFRCGARRPTARCRAPSHARPPKRAAGRPHARAPHSGAVTEKLVVEDLISTLRQSTVLGSTVIPVLKHVWTEQARGNPVCAVAPSNATVAHAGRGLLLCECARAGAGAAGGGADAGVLGWAARGFRLEASDRDRVQQPAAAGHAVRHAGSARRGPERQCLGNLGQPDRQRVQGPHPQTWACAATVAVWALTAAGWLAGVALAPRRVRSAAQNFLSQVKTVAATLETM